MTGAQNNLSWKDAIRVVLSESKKPMSYTDIADEIAARGLRKSFGATPANSVYTSLSLMGDEVEKVRKGVFALARSSSTSEQNDDDCESDSSDSIGDETYNEPQSSLIANMGIYWERDKLDLSKSNPPIIGRFSPESKPVDFSEQQCVYVLYDGPKPVYAGQVRAERLGGRLRDHSRKRLASRWNRFSWFGFRPVLDNGQLGEFDSTRFSQKDIIDAFEAILIETLETPQNRRAGDFKDAMLFTQC